MASVPNGDERQPLLGVGQHESLTYGPSEREVDAEVQQVDTLPSAIPLAEEPSTLKLAVIMSACWLGTFLAALGVS